MNNDERDTGLKLTDPTLSPIVADLEARIQECFSELDAGNFTEGSLTLKLNMQLIDDVETYAVKGKSVDGVTTAVREEVYGYKKPAFEYKSTLSFKKRKDTKATFNPQGVELKKVDGEFIIVKIEENQLNLKDYD